MHPNRRNLPQFRDAPPRKREVALDTVREIPVVDPMKVAQHRETWVFFGLAIMQARIIRPDDPDTGINGTYMQATEALHWLLSADSAAWMLRIGCEQVVPETLRYIGYHQLFDRIVQAAKASDTGRRWMLNTPQFMEMEMLVRAADQYFAAEATTTVSMA